jgi:4-carboxymuconolactone decarboxylase
VTRSPEQQAYLDQMVARRGYVLPYHEALVDNDLEVMRSMDDLVARAYLDERSLSGREKELIFVVSLTVMRADPGHIEGHIRKALALGVPAGDILEAIEIALPEAGVVAFQHGVECWLRVVAADEGPVDVGGT